MRTIPMYISPHELQKSIVQAFNHIYLICERMHCIVLCNSQGLYAYLRWAMEPSSHLAWVQRHLNLSHKIFTLGRYLKPGIKHL